MKTRLFEVNFTSSVAVRFEDEQHHPRVIVVGKDLEEKLAKGQFFWSNHLPHDTDLLLDPTHWPSLGTPICSQMSVALSSVRTQRSIFWQLRQPRVDFLFTTTAQADDLWWAWTLPQHSKGALVGLTNLSNQGLGFPTPGEISVADWLPSQGEDNELRVQVHNAADYARWTSEKLPFHIRYKAETPNPTAAREQNLLASGPHCHVPKATVIAV